MKKKKKQAHETLRVDVTIRCRFYLSIDMNRVQWHCLLVMKFINDMKLVLTGSSSSSCIKNLSRRISKYRGFSISLFVTFENAS